MMPAALPALVDELPAPITLTEGSTIRFGPISPASRPLIQAAVGRLSPETSRRRFFTVRHRLSEEELDRLTRLDGWNRYAIGASAHLPDGRVEGAGVARFARLAEIPDAAEFALVVVDAYQGRGIGKRLLAAISRAALARSVHRLRGIVLHDNRPMLRLLARHAPGLERIDTGEHYEVEVRLDPRRAALAA